MVFEPPLPCHFEPQREMTRQSAVRNDGEGAARHEDPGARNDGVVVQ
jgi:hypothetical protein